jgi:arylsulfatase A-like enzyme
VYRTGLSKVGLPGATVGLQAEDPTIAELLKNHGYATGQFGKNHLGDRNEYLPTVHGFDEFFGNLYHLNAEEDPEDPDYPTVEEAPHFKERFGPRGVLRCWATDQDDATEDSRWGRVGRQRIEDTRSPNEEADGDLRR